MSQEIKNNQICMLTPPVPGTTLGGKCQDAVALRVAL